MLNVIETDMFENLNNTWFDRFKTYKNLITEVKKSKLITINFSFIYFYWIAFTFIVQMPHQYQEYLKSPMRYWSIFSKMVKSKR